MRNIGLEKCDSRYVLIQDADDVSVGNRMEIILDAFKAAPDRLAVGGEAIVVDADGNRTGYLRAPSSSAAITAAAFFYYPMVHPAAAINFTAIRRLGAAYGKDFLNVVPASESITVNRFAEDYILFGQLALLGLCANIPVPLIKYRRHGNSVGVANHAAQVEASLQISRFLSKSFCLMNRAEELIRARFAIMRTLCSTFGARIIPPSSTAWPGPCGGDLDPRPNWRASWRSAGSWRTEVRSHDVPLHGISVSLCGAAPGTAHGEKLAAAKSPPQQICLWPAPCYAN